MHSYKRLIWGFGLLTIIGVAACSGGDMNSPTSPSANSATGATIAGTVQLAAAGPSAGQLAAQSSMSIEVCVSGTTICNVIDGEGKFILSGPEIVGDIELVFKTLDGTVLMTAILNGVLPDERVVVSVDLSENRFRVETRVGGDDDDDDSSDDDSMDDDSTDDDSSDDDSSDDSSDDDSSDDDSSDDDSSDDDDPPSSGPGSGNI